MVNKWLPRGPAPPPLGGDADDQPAAGPQLAFLAAAEVERPHHGLAVAGRREGLLGEAIGIGAADEAIGTQNDYKSREGPAASEWAAGPGGRSVGDEAARQPP